MEEGEEIFKSLVDSFFLPLLPSLGAPPPTNTHTRKVVKKSQLLVASL